MGKFAINDEQSFVMPICMDNHQSKIDRVPEEERRKQPLGRAALFLFLICYSYLLLNIC